jgi:hypothetical protein
VKLGFQDFAVALIALAALAWLVVRRVRASRKKGGACPDCPMGEASAHRPAAARPLPAVTILYPIEPRDPRASKR